MIGVTENFRKIQDLLAKATAEAGRARESVTLLAVSKSQPASAVLEGIRAGQRHFGENFVQEALSKIREVERDGVVWHFIGQLQSNKTKAVAENFQWVHAIDRLKIAKRLSSHRPYYAGELDVCIEVNVDGEPGKGGVAPAELLPLATEIAGLPRLKFRGLMCIPAPRKGFDAQREPFRQLRELAATLAEAGIATDTLSMGMTADFVAAIHEGATIVRIGTALFGERR